MSQTAMTSRRPQDAGVTILHTLPAAALVALLDQSADFLGIASLAGQVVFVNPAGQQMVGLDGPEQVRATVIFDYVADTDRERWQTAIWPTVLQQGQWDGEMPLRHFKTGMVMPMRHRLVVLKDAQGQQPLALAMISRTLPEPQCVETAVRAIAEGVSAATGVAFFRSLMQYLATTVAVEYAFVGEMSHEHDNMIRTVAVCADGQTVPNFAYDLRDTPCQQVTSGTLCVYPERVQSRFPRDRVLAEMGIEGYVGTPLVDSQARVIGLMVLLSRRPLTHPELCVATLRIFATRAAAELERQQAEEAVRASEQRWRTLFEHAALGIALVDAAGRLVHSNPALQRMLDYTAAELRRMSFVEFTHPEDITKDWALASEVFTGQRDFYQLEKRYIRKDGQVRWGHLTASAIRDEHGGWQLGVGMVEDITERKQAEEAVYESEERFRQLTDNIRDVFWMTTPDMREILYISPAYETVWGRTRASLYHDAGSFLDAIHPEDRPRVVELLAREGEREFAAEYRVLRPDGSIRWIWDRRFPVKDHAGHVYRLAGIAEDITERKHAEEELRATSAQLRTLMASLRSAKEHEGLRIAREIHDELGSALTSLKWDLEEIATTLAETEDRARRPTVRDKIGTMVGLLETTMQVVRRIASELRPRLLDDLGLAAALEWHLHQFQARTGIQCRYAGAGDDLDMDQEHATAIFRIVQEALTNVLRHAHATRVDVRLEEAGPAWVLTVWDNGRGITEAEQSGRRALGLLGMRERAHLIGGRLEITGRRGQGTTVTVHVPQARAQQGSPSALSLIPGAASPAHPGAAQKADP